ncbi:hypothetical protein ABEB36_008086 [Hypothenemus hampei]|uniref:TRUD domain-containing protein n=1 Tax=Hypothenemus hampei TaxID=57062 RepID=A0ABD1EL41_HYPHA
MYSSRNNHSKKNFFKKKRNNSNFVGHKLNTAKTEYRHHDQLTEEEVGIDAYISSLAGFSAVIKARFSDFQVNEIDLNGRIAKLTDVAIPKQFENSTEKAYSYEDTENSPCEKLPQEIWNNLKKLASVENHEPIELDVHDLSKNERKTIHICVKNYFGQRIVASTVSKDGKTTLQFKKFDKKGKHDERLQWPENLPEFVHFILYKEMIDTMDACSQIAQALRIPPMKLIYAGVKDKRAKTSQWFCIKKYHPVKIVTNLKRFKNLKVGNFEFKNEPLKLGQLIGNRFRIALRNVLADDQFINDSFKQVGEHGFINYYGLQRFGNDKEAPTFLIGVKLIQNNWKEAIQLILKVKAADDLNLPINLAKKVYAETGDAEKAFKLCDKRGNSVEKKLLEGLAKHPKSDYVNALEYIPRRVRLMYIHSFQSLIFNKIASKRVKEFGLKPVEGDLILLENIQEEKELYEQDDEEADEKEKTKVSLVKPLKTEELDQYTIFDIVLPLPGYNIVYPENLKQYYKEELTLYGLTLEMAKKKVKSYNLSGTYRKLIQKANDFDWKIMHYNNPTDNLIQSDLEELNGEAEPQSVEDGKYKAVVLAFNLCSSSYATMVLREILKCNTSSSAQASLNHYVIENKSDGNHMENGINEVQDSLLRDKERYEDFKKTVFSDTLEKNSDGATKREFDGNETDVNNKKMKCDANE